MYLLTDFFCSESLYAAREPKYSPTFVVCCLTAIPKKFVSTIGPASEACGWGCLRTEEKHNSATSVLRVEYRQFRGYPAVRKSVAQRAFGTVFTWISFVCVFSGDFSANMLLFEFSKLIFCRLPRLLVVKVRIPFCFAKYDLALISCGADGAMGLNYKIFIPLKAKGSSFNGH